MNVVRTQIVEAHPYWRAVLVGMPALRAPKRHTGPVHHTISGRRTPADTAGVNRDISNPCSRQRPCGAEVVGAGTLSRRAHSPNATHCHSPH